MPVARAWLSLKLQPSGCPGLWLVNSNNTGLRLVAGDLSCSTEVVILWQCHRLCEWGWSPNMVTYLANIEKIHKCYCTYANVFSIFQFTNQTDIQTLCAYLFYIDNILLCWSIYTWHFKANQSRACWHSRPMRGQPGLTRGRSEHGTRRLLLLVSSGQSRDLGSWQLGQLTAVTGTRGKLSGIRHH